VSAQSNSSIGYVSTGNTGSCDSNCKQGWSSSGVGIRIGNITINGDSMLNNEIEKSTINGQ